MSLTKIDAICHGIGLSVFLSDRQRIRTQVRRDEVPSLALVSKRDRHSPGACGNFDELQWAALACFRNKRIAKFQSNLD